MGMAFALCVLGTAVNCYPQASPETVDQVRIGQLEREVGAMTDFERRLIRLEDTAASIREHEDEAQWWYRGIGGALILAVLERILRTVGILRDKSDGMGPVG